jgi:isoquinoline 1-oxidoreductase alpha subunit
MRINVNGESHETNVPDETPLLWVVREEMGKTGTKFGCGMGLCGACTCLADGQAIRSCVTPVASVQGKKLTTIEGLSPDGNHPLQQAWREINVVQCGYCQSGQLMSAAALLAQKSSPTDQDIDDAMAGNICRCGTYDRIRAAIKRAAEILRGANK